MVVYITDTRYMIVYSREVKEFSRGRITFENGDWESSSMSTEFFSSEEEAKTYLKQQIEDEKRELEKRKSLLNEALKKI